MLVVFEVFRGWLVYRIVKCGLYDFCASCDEVVIGQMEMQNLHRHCR